MSTEMAENVSETAGPPPIAMVLPVLQSVLTGSSLLFRLAIRFLITTVSPLHLIWSTIHALLLPIIIAVQVTLDMVLFTPFSLVRMVAVALYPLYVFFAVACIIGATVGIFGRYISITILRSISKSRYFTQPPSTPPVTPPLAPQVTLRKRKRKSVRMP